MSEKVWSMNDAGYLDIDMVNITIHHGNAKERVFVCYPRELLLDALLASSLEDAKKRGDIVCGKFTFYFDIPPIEGEPVIGIQFETKEDTDLVVVNREELLLALLKICL